jgi:hypothetical protein
MKRAIVREVLDLAPRRATSEEMDPALIKFVEALAIADRRRKDLHRGIRVAR